MNGIPGQLNFSYVQNGEQIEFAVNFPTCIIKMLACDTLGSGGPWRCQTNFDPEDGSERPMTFTEKKEVINAMRHSIVDVYLRESNGKKSLDLIYSVIISRQGTPLCGQKLPDSYFVNQKPFQGLYTLFASCEVRPNEKAVIDIPSAGEVIIGFFQDDASTGDNYSKVNYGYEGSKCIKFDQNGDIVIKLPTDHERVYLLRHSEIEKYSAIIKLGVCSGDCIIQRRANGSHVNESICGSNKSNGDAKGAMERIYKATAQPDDLILTEAIDDLKKAMYEECSHLLESFDKNIEYINNKNLTLLSGLCKVGESPDRLLDVLNTNYFANSFLSKEGAMCNITEVVHKWDITTEFPVNQSRDIFDACSAGLIGDRNISYVTSESSQRTTLRTASTPQISTTKASTEKPTTLQTTGTSQRTTTKASTEKPTTLQITGTSQRTTTKTSTEKPTTLQTTGTSQRTTTKASTEKPTTLQTTGTSRSITTKTSTEKPTTLQITGTSQRTTTKTSTEKPTTLQTTGTSQRTTTKTSTEKPTTLQTTGASQRATTKASTSSYTTKKHKKSGGGGFAKTTAKFVNNSTTVPLSDFTTFNSRGVTSTAALSRSSSGVSSTDIGMYAGVSVAIAFFIAICVTLVCYICRKRKPLVRKLGSSNLNASANSIASANSTTTIDLGEENRGRSSSQTDSDVSEALFVRGQEPSSSIELMCVERGKNTPNEHGTETSGI